MISQKINWLILSSCFKKSTNCILTSAIDDNFVEGYACTCCVLTAESTDQMWSSQDTNLN